MKRTALLFIIILATVLSIVSCNNHTDKQKDGRLQQQAENNIVEVITLKKTDFPRQLLSNGKLVAAARASLSFSSPGPLSSIPVRNGERVSKGAVLAKVSRPDLELALESAQLSLEKAGMDLYDYLVGQGYPARDTSSVPTEIMAMARMKSGYSIARNALSKARLDLDGTVLKAPFAGRVADIRLRKHDLSGTDTFCTLVDDSSFDVDFTVMESEYNFLSKGLAVKVTPFADDSYTCEGRITDINPVVDKNGQITVRASVKGAARLLDGMNVKVVVERMIPDVLVVPRSAVVIRDNLNVLFTYTDDGKAHWTYVTIITSNGDSHVVTANTSRGAVLSEGDRVIVSGNLNLADGSSVVLGE